MTLLSVSSLNEQLKSLLETTFCSIHVEGEISNLTYHNSGHIYFSIKDKSSTISCVMFRGNARYLKFRLEVGQKIIISGSITVYAPRGNYQLLCQKIEPSGIGSLALAYEQLKTKLQIQGYFDSSIKKELPSFPNIIYVITSNTGAAIEDMKKILANRYPLAKMILLPTLVQGEGAKEDIVKNIIRADKLALEELKSIIIVGRGGGSIEDLWAFNEEIVADAIYNAKTPIISAVGHENDFVISDFVADIRASTPSNAIELSTPSINDYRQYLDSLVDDFRKFYQININNKIQLINSLTTSFKQNSINVKFKIVSQEINHIKNNISNQFLLKIKSSQQNLNLLKNTYINNKPSNKDKKGFVQISQNNKLVNLEDLQLDSLVSLQNSNIIINCQVKSKKLL